MFEKLPVKKKHVLILATIVMVLISYNLAFKKTYEAWQQYSQLKTQLNSSANLALQPGYVIRKRRNLDSVLAMYKTDTTTFRNNTLSRIAIIAEKENVRLNEVPTDDPILHTDKFILQRLEFEGDFFSLTRVLNDLQSVSNIGLVRSIEYKTVKAANLTDKKLSMDVYIEMIGY